MSSINFPHDRMIPVFENGDCSERLESEYLQEKFGWSVREILRLQEPLTQSKNLDHSEL